MRRCAAGLAVLAGSAAAGAVALAQSGAAPAIVPRSAWGAKPAVTARMRPQTPRAIVVHHTGVKQQPKLSLGRKLRGLQGYAQAPGTVSGRPKAAWGDIPYHFYIDSAGRIGEGRDVGYAGDTNTAYSIADRIQIVLEGNFETEEPSAAQLASLDRLVIWLARRYHVPAGRISGHGDHASTECPGRHLESYLPTLRAKVAKASAVR